MDRRRIADILDECGTLLELKGENPFRSNAYHNAARAITQLEGDVATMLQSGELAKVKGLGATMIEKIAELLTTGVLAFHEDLKRDIPSGMVEMLRIPGFGPKRIKLVHDQLGIDSIELLRAHCLDGTLAKVKGLGKKTAENILVGIAFLEKAGKRVLLPVAHVMAENLRTSLKALPEVKRLAICGSLRRGKETIKDIDILVASDNPQPVMEAFVNHLDVVNVTGHGDTKSSIVLAHGVAADLRVVDEKQFPFALLYFTGSKEHNVALRGRAQDRGLKLNEYELAGASGGIHCPDESAIYEALGLAYIPPELREDTGEIEAAERGTLPHLVELDDIQGVFHCHTTYSDGRATLEAMAAAAKTKGHQYWGVADHSKTAFYANGLSPDRLLEQLAHVERLQQSLTDFHIFRGIESDILADGSLDYDDVLLSKLDYVVASVHQPMNMSEEQMTKRILNAIRHPLCTMLGHMTGRLLLQREPYPVDVDAVLREAARLGTMIEINANPHRLDLDWTFCKRAKALGVLLVINPDAHETEGLDDLQYGVLTARRGWLEKENIFNTRDVREVAQKFQEMKGGV